MERKLSEKIMEKIRDPEMWLTLVKRILITICFVWLCRLDQVINSATGWIQHAQRNYIGVAIAVLILCAYRPRDFLKLPYLIWTVIFFIGRHFALEWAPTNVDNVGRFESTVWNVGIYGIICIRMFYHFCIEKKRPAMNWPVFGIWLAMMTGMLLSRSNEPWHPWFFLWFGALYLTSYNKRDFDTLFTGMLDGIIIGFIIVQTQACMHRPYDIIRYTGFQSNPNTNALFYTVVYCGVLCKWYQMKLKQRHLLLRFPFVILCGVLISLTFLTMGRTAVITMILITLLFLAFQVLSAGNHKLIQFMIDGAAILLLAAVCFLPTFWLVRYVPAYVNDPIYFEGDKVATKVHKDDPVDSEKYIELEDVLQGTFGRILWFLDFTSDEVSRIFKPSMVAYAAEMPGPAPIGTDADNPMLVNPEDVHDPVKIRTSIYKYYLSHLNLTGHTLDEHGCWVSGGYFAPHAHNVLLQMAFSYGIPVGCLFVIMIAFAYIKLFRGIRSYKTGRNYFYLLCLGGFTTVFAAFGMLEISWNFGQLAFTMFFVVLYPVCHRQQKKMMVVAHE